MVEDNNVDNAGQGSVDDSPQCSSSGSGGGTCCSSGSGGCGKMKFIVFAIIVVAAGIIMARSLMRESTMSCEDARRVFSTIIAEPNSESSPQISAVTGVETSGESEVSLWGAELVSLVSLNEIATDLDAVFVFLAADDQQGSEVIIGEIEVAAKRIQSSGDSIRVFRLKKDTSDYAMLAKQFSVPCVVAMVQGGGMSTVSGEITEGELIVAFVKASRPMGSCSPGGSCEPSKCD